jgi:hypothetical protein
MSIELDSDTLEPNSTTGYTLILSNIDTAMQINTAVNISSGSQKVGEIQVDIYVSIRGSPAPGGAGTISVSPLVWTGDFIVGDSASKTFTISNDGDSSLSSLSYTADYEIDNIANVSLPSYISAGGSASMTVELNPSSSGTYSGELIVKAGTASQSILISANFFSDIASDVNNTRDELSSFINSLSGDEYNQLSDVISDIQDYLNDADSDIVSGRYAAANSNLETANAQLDVLKNIYTYLPSNGGGGGGGEFDFTIIIIVVVVVAAGVGVWFFLKKVRSPKSLEEELEEEY